MAPREARTMSRKALLGLVLLGWALRGIALLTYPLDYDEGVYYAAAALWLKGCWPYRDFVFAHPPGILYALMPFTLLRPSQGILWARLAMSCVGAANIAMVAQLSRRSFGPQAACLSALCYALYPEAVASERRLLLEPLLNCFILLGLLSRRRILSAAWLGCALSVKAWAALWVVTSWPRLRLALLATVAVAGLLCLPPFQAAPQAFWHDVVLFHLQRPPHHPQGLVSRLLDVFDPRHLVITGLALLGWWRCSETTPFTRQMAWSWGLLLLALILGPAHFFQYNTHLALPECFWAGAAWQTVWRQPRLASVLLAIPLGFSLAGWLKTDPATSPRAAAIRSQVGRDSLYAFEPGYGLWADRLPDHNDGAPVIVDSYATMLIDAGPGFASVPEAMASEKSQTRLRQRLQTSRWVVIEERAHDQVAEGWLQKHFKPKAGDLWHAR